MRKAVWRHDSARRRHGGVIHFGKSATVAAVSWDGCPATLAGQPGSRWAAAIC